MLVASGGRQPASRPNALMNGAKMVDIGVCNNAHMVGGANHIGGTIEEAKAAISLWKGTGETKCCHDR